ncbi:MAG: PQQ-binding-like beta-propeller repeat protein [Chloroflexi bacterium]|nr:PQQ-binding-like beta-propeller repeat protein [Chloroflexota bacterium]
MESTLGDRDELPRFPGPAQTGPSRGGRNRLGCAVALVTAAMLAAVIGVLYLPSEHAPQGPVFPFGDVERPLEQVTQLTFDATLQWQLPISQAGPAAAGSPGFAAMPSDMATLNGRIFVLDTNNGRVVEIDPTGGVLKTLDQQTDARLALVLPMAMAAHDDRLYVANSGAGNVVVLDPDSGVERVITPVVPAGASQLRPIGIAVAAGGEIFLSDPDNNRVLHLDQNGGLLSTIGLGQRDSGEYGFNSPGALTLDAEGNLYVVDMLNYALKKYAPSGRFLMTIGQAGDTEGTFSRPKGVAVDGSGRMYVSDTLLAAVQVFGPDGQYQGFIGRQDPLDKQSGSLFQAPHGLKVAGDVLYVVDRFAGVFAFQIAN